MNQINRAYVLYLEDMLLSMNRIEEYVGTMDFTSFKRTYIVFDAVVRNFEIIGEASKKIPNNIQEKYPEIPWRKMNGLKNLIAHEYFGVDYEMIREIVKENLPQNKADLLRATALERMAGGSY